MNPSIQQRKAPVRAIAAIVMLAFLAGCATLSDDGGFGSVQSAAKERGLKQDIQWIKTEQEAENARASVRKLLAAPLTAETAVQIALLNNRGLQATYAELGIAEAATADLFLTHPPPRTAAAQKLRAQLQSFLL